ncbi:UvrD-helicase domain-containing protein [Psychrobacter sp. SZ93C1]|uniref:UvrD-helicase domain-containing protein n=1 Tax=Psychrobacter sp. SZ93C1 TaxID=2792058 RepID=UPI0018CCF1BB|nr:ATP-dependent helicase [Psychrobacter sp. SZ93C1]MBH0066064.1 ATP-dependent helicase [Psychrobacter sp. SZ93C1]
MILNNLTREQKLAVQQDGHVLLSACPGSGKTRTIIHKLAYESSRLDDNSKKKVVAVTFTIRASDEIFNRLNRMSIDSSRIWSGTLHSFCLEWILKPYSCYLLELQNGYTIADEAYKISLINDLKEKYRVNLYIDNTRLDRNGSFVESDNRKKAILNYYHQDLKEQKLIDFDLLLYYSYQLLVTYPKIGRVLSNLFHLICVDEYQDTQDLSYAIICNIINANNGNTSLFLAGDIDQAIYHSLGGVAKNKTEIESELNGQKIIEMSLTGNFRSTQRIIDYYNSFQSNPIPIIAQGANANEQGVISYNNTVNQDELVNELVRLIQENINNGIAENEICVLFPQWWLITSITGKLKSLLPDVNFDASGLAPMSKNRDNFWYTLSHLFLTESSPTIYSLRYKWAKELIDKFHEHTGTEFPEPYYIERNILRLTNSITSDKTEVVSYLEDCFFQFANKLNLDSKKYPSLGESWKVYFKNIKLRLNDRSYNVPSDIDSFKKLYKERGGIVINTCMGIKGEEFETVIAFGLLNGYIPHSNEASPHHASNKMMYVISSRAKKNLHLISETGRMIRDSNGVATPVLSNKRYTYDK